MKSTDRLRAVHMVRLRLRFFIATRMHSSRMRTAHSSICLGGGSGPDPPEFPLGCGPGSDPPEFSPWVWAWIWSPWISPFGVGLDLIPLNFPPLIWSPCQGSLPGGGFPWRGVSLLSGSPCWESPWWGVSLAGVSLPGGSPCWGVSLAGGVSLVGGLPARGSPRWGGLPAGGSPSMHWHRPPSSVDRQTPVKT